MINKLRELNMKLIEVNMGKEEEKKYQVIKKILSDDKCFFKMEIEYAYSILRDLGIPEEELKNYYSELIDIKNG